MAKRKTDTEEAQAAEPADTSALQQMEPLSDEQFAAMVGATTNEEPAETNADLPETNADLPEIVDDVQTGAPELQPKRTVRVYHEFSAQDMQALVSEALRGKSQLYLELAAEERPKKAANDALIARLEWGANELYELAEVVDRIPEGEWRTEEV